MIALRWRPEWFKCKSTLGYGRDWPISFDELEPYYEEAEEALKISGPIHYPWGRRRKRYPYRAHPVNAAGLVLARGLRGDRHQMVAAPPRDALRAARHGASLRLSRLLRLRLLDQRQAERARHLHPARAEGRRGGSRSRDGRPDRDGQGRPGARPDLPSRAATWRHQKAKHVVVAGYAIETPRLLLNSQVQPVPRTGSPTRTGLVGTHIMIHSGPGVWGVMDEEVRCYKAPPCMAVTEHWNYDDSDKKDFHGGYAFMSQGPLPVGWAQAQAINRGMWGMKLRQEMTRYNHIAGLAHRRRDRAAAAQPRRGRGREGPVRPSNSRA